MQITSLSSLPLDQPCLFPLDQPRLFHHALTPDITFEILGTHAMWASPSLTAPSEALAHTTSPLPPNTCLKHCHLLLITSSFTLLIYVPWTIHTFVTLFPSNFKDSSQISLLKHIRRLKDFAIVSVPQSAPNKHVFQWRSQHGTNIYLNDTVSTEWTFLASPTLHTTCWGNRDEANFWRTVKSLEYQPSANYYN